MKFICLKCKKEFQWFMRGGTGWLIKYDPDKKINICCYCRGNYPDGTGCNK